MFDEVWVPTVMLYARFSTCESYFTHGIIVSESSGIFPGAEGWGEVTWR